MSTCGRTLSRNHCSDKMRLLIECRSVTPNDSCGIETFVYSLVAGFQALPAPPNVTINTSPGLQEVFARNFSSHEYLSFTEDPVAKKIIDWRNRSLAGRICIATANRLRKRLGLSALGFRETWLRKLAEQADVVLYPYQRDSVCHGVKPYVIVMHDFYDFEFGDADRSLREREEMALRGAAAIVTCWPGPHRSLLSRFPTLSSKAFNIPFVTHDLDVGLSSGVIKSRSVRATPQLVYAASLAPHKNHENLILALGVLRRRGWGGVRVFCPGGNDVSRLKTLKALASQEQVTSWVEFPGFIPRERLTSIYGDADGVVAPTLYEAFSGTVLEGLQRGLPVACSDISAHRAFFEDFNGRALFFNPGCPISIADAIAELCSENCFTYSGWSIDMRNKLAKITAERTASRFERVLKWACGQGPNPGGLDWAE